MEEMIFRKEELPSTSSSSDERLSEIDSLPGSCPDGDEHHTTDSVSDEAWKQRLAQRENRAVLHLRILVFLVLILAATAVSVVVFFITKKAQEDEFETQYLGSAEKIKEAFQGIVKQKLGAISSVAVATIAHGVDHLRSWPFVTLSSFQQRCATARSLSGALFVSVNPFVNETQRPEWEEYVLSDDSYWVEEGFNYQKLQGLSNFEPRMKKSSIEAHEQIFYFDNEEKLQVEPEQSGPYMPVWQTSPVLQREFINQNLFHNQVHSKGSRKCLETEKVVIGQFDTAPPGDVSHPNSKTSFYASLLSIAAGTSVRYDGDPISSVYLPVFSSFEEERKPVAVMMAIINWASYFKQVLPPNVRGIVAVLNSACGGSHTYQIDGEEVNYLGTGDLHDNKFDYMVESATFEDFPNIADGTKYGLFLDQSDCPVTLKIYPSESFYQTYNQNTPVIVTFAVAMVFAFTATMFLVYDRLVERRQHIVMKTAENSTAIVSSLFPRSVRDRLMQEREEQARDSCANLFSSKHRLKSFLDSGEDGEMTDLGLQPIADFFPHTTVMFADIAGFTAWSSTREPAQVFILLQTLYHAFDSLAKKHKVFKVETIGDSYVAVTGLPDPQERHAVIMARFACDCLFRMKEIVRDLEVTLGPETCGLQMRFGVHSGPCTAGVLRGNRPRFQLFGDTVNTAARMESTGHNGRIQCSKATAELLLQAGKGHWITPRKEPVQAKGKGLLNTFWLMPYDGKRGSFDSWQASASFSQRALAPEHEMVKVDRLVDWMCELLHEQIKKILATRLKVSKVHERSINLSYFPPAGTIALDEVTEVITLPEFDARLSVDFGEAHSVDMSQTAKAQLRRFVMSVANLYHHHPFHCWEHACHVSMSVNKLLKRVVRPEVNPEDVINNSGELASQIHDYTHGINSDPITILAILVSAMIHDIGHQGVSNNQLMKEDKALAEKYRRKSVAEQNSFDLSWDMLMSDDFAALRRCLFSGQDELRRFRQVLLNCVMATDIFDKDMNQLRKQRWEKAFSTDLAGKEANDLRATIVIEHIIQASDVSHTMQHWHIYRRWNKKLFHEMYLAYLAGRLDKDPATFWYKGELSFFDGYVIPLAKKLQECNVFGVSSDEYLSYAKQNRAEWEEKGMEIVEEMKEACMHESKRPRSYRRASSSSESRSEDEKKSDIFDS